MKNTLHYALILDQSGSMQDIKNVTISSFNEQIDSIRNLLENNPESEVKITFCVFNQYIDLRFVAADIDKIVKLDHANYKPNSNTALYDAMGITMLRLQETVAPEDKIFMAVFTDGLENASTHYSGPDISQRMEVARSQGWNIRFYCNVEDVNYFQRNLRLNNNELHGIQLNESGVKKMKMSINSMFEKLIDRT